jgi:hypothetical protein
MKPCRGYGDELLAFRGNRVGEGSVTRRGVEGMDDSSVHRNLQGDKSRWRETRVVSQVRFRSKAKPMPDFRRTDDETINGKDELRRF